MSFLFKPEPNLIINPRKYQRDAFEAVKVYLEYRQGNPCVVLPTGAGKTILIVMLCQWAQSWGGRVLILAHVKELLQQAADKLNDMSPELGVGVYSAGLERREKHYPITIAGIQSIYQRAGEFEAFDLIILDECHRLPPDGEGMYRSFLADAQEINPHLRLVGLTATPYRMTTGNLCGDDQLLRAVCYEIGVLDLINQGFLANLRSKRVVECDTSGLHVKGGEFVADEVALLMCGEATVVKACEEILLRTQECKSVLVFCANVDHAQNVATKLSGRYITGETPSDERDKLLRAFKSNQFKYLTNVRVLCEGFDAPGVDCVVLLNPTLSPGLYYQMVGRGFRLAPAKEFCLVLDFAGNTQRHGPINALRIDNKKGSKGSGFAPTKVCPECDEVVLLGLRSCPSCNYEWPRDPVKHDFRPGDLSIIDEENGEEEFKVLDVKYSKHVKKNSPPEHPATLRVDYQVSIAKWVTEWVCIEHDGFAGNKAKLWWRLRSADPIPLSVLRAVEIAEGDGLAVPLKVRFKPDGKHTRITRVELGPKPAAVEICSCGGIGCVKCEFDFAAMAPEQEIDFDDLPF